MACTFQQPVYSPVPHRGIRVIVAHPDPVRRNEVRTALFTTAGYDVIAETASASELAKLVAAEEPELIVGSLPVLLSTDMTNGAFPLCIGIGAEPVTSSERTVATLDETVIAPAIANALATATVRILNAKANELSKLIRHYLLHRDVQSQCRPTLEVEREGQRIEIEAEDVTWIKASGNYVRLHTASGAYMMRSTIRSVAASLRQLGFVRIHRGWVVNTASIRSQIVLQDGAVAVVLDDGTQLPVGASYRGSVTQKKQVSAPYKHT